MCLSCLTGKSSILSMITRDLLPTAGDAYINGHSVLSAFSLATRYIYLYLIHIQEYVYLYIYLYIYPPSIYLLI